MRSLKILAYSILSFLGAAEVAGLIEFYKQTGRFFYTTSTVSSENAALNQSSGTTDFRLHPFFGYVLRPQLSLREYLNPQRVAKLYEVGGEPAWLDLKTNAYGFFSNLEYPVARNKPNQFLIGIFGGSLAHWFTLQGADTLIRALKLNPKLNGKEIIIINFAAGGFKQPQQLLVLNYFLTLGQSLDLAINIDGFNEIALSEKNIEAGISISMPSAQHLAPFSKLLSSSKIDADYIQSLARLLSYKNDARWFAKCSQESSVAAQYLLCASLARYNQSRYQQQQIAADKLLADGLDDSLLELLPKSASEDLSGYFAPMASQWAEASKQMNLILTAKNTQYLHILQPNQYVSKKVFSAEEERLARSGDSPYDRSGIVEGYRRLSEKGSELRESGVAFYDATSAFDGESSILFSDNCCHLNQRGNDLFARYVASVIEGLLSPSSRGVQR